MLTTLQEILPTLLLHFESNDRILPVLNVTVLKAIQSLRILWSLKTIWPTLINAQCDSSTQILSSPQKKLNLLVESRENFPKEGMSWFAQAAHIRNHSDINGKSAAHRAAERVLRGASVGAKSHVGGNYVITPITTPE